MCSHVICLDPTHLVTCFLINFPQLLSLVTPPHLLPLKSPCVCSSRVGSLPYVGVVVCLLSCLVQLCLVQLCLVQLCLVQLCLSSFALSSPALSSPCLVQPALSSPALSCPALSCPALSCPALSSPALSCPALSCPALSCPGLSCPALSSPALSSLPVCFSPKGCFVCFVYHYNKKPFYLLQLGSSLSSHYLYLTTALYSAPVSLWHCELDRFRVLELTMTWLPAKWFISTSVADKRTLLFSYSCHFLFRCRWVDEPNRDWPRWGGARGDSPPDFGAGRCRYFTETVLPSPRGKVRNCED